MRAAERLAALELESRRDRVGERRCPRKGLEHSTREPGKRTSSSRVRGSAQIPNSRSALRKTGASVLEWTKAVITARRVAW
jgi:hypothetical protein